jgi:DNA-binding NtrC family response regulator
MVARFANRFRKALLAISRGALVALQSFLWPRNFRQLENVVQNAVLGTSGSERPKEPASREVAEAHRLVIRPVQVPYILFRIAAPAPGMPRAYSKPTSGS